MSGVCDRVDGSYIISIFAFVCVWVGGWVGGGALMGASLPCGRP